MKLYKLTQQDMTTYMGSTKWGKGVTHEKPVKANPQMCCDDVLHAYKNLNLAFLMNPNHANISNPLVFEVEGEVVVSDYGKVGCFKLTTVKRIAKPKWLKSKAKQVQIQFAILCALEVIHYFEDKYPNDNRPRKAIEAAQEYLKNPSTSAARAAAAAAYAAAARAARADAAAAAYAADAAARAAAAAAYAAAARAARADADAAAYAADAAARAAVYAADAADAAARAAVYAADARAVKPVDFGALADKAVHMIMKGRRDDKRQ